MKATEAFLTDRRRGRLYSRRVELCAAVIEIAGRKLQPDKSKAYVEFHISQGLQVRPGGELAGVSAWNTAQHPGTVANSYGSMLDKPFNRGHEMKHYDPDKIARDHIIGSVVAVEFPRAPGAGWSVRGTASSPDPIVRGAAVIFKNAEGVPKILGEHLGNRHKWMVSHELDYSLVDSGFVVGKLDAGRKDQTELCASLTPDEFSGVGFGYVPCLDAPDELLECYNPDKRLVDKLWGRLPVTLLAGGINGTNHYQGVGMVRYGADREAEIQQLLASHPDALELLEEDGVIDLLGCLKDFATNLEKVLTEISSDA